MRDVTDEVVERGARALREQRNVQGVGDPGPWEEASAHSREAYRREARAVLLAVLSWAPEAAPEDTLADRALEKLHEWLMEGVERTVTIEPDYDPCTAATDVHVQLGWQTGGDGHPINGVGDADAILPVAILGALDAHAEAMGG